MAQVKISTKLNVPMFTGVIISEWSEDGVSCYEVEKPDGKIVVLSERYYNLQEADEPTASEPMATDPTAVGVPAVPVLPPKPKSKESLTDDDIERVLSKVSDVSLTTLKSMGLKSGQLYPLMIKINDALRATLSTKKG